MTGSDLHSSHKGRGKDNVNNLEKHTFESALRRLEEIVDELEMGKASLEDSISGFAEGMELVKFCAKKLDTVEKKLQKLTGREDGSFDLGPLEEGENGGDNQFSEPR